MRLVCLFLAISIVSQRCTGEVFTALVEMESLLHTQETLIKTVDQYIKYEEERLSTMRRFVRDFERTYNEASPDIQGYLSHPINAYLLVKRLTSDWKELQDFMLENRGKYVVENMTNMRDVLKFPDEEDLSGAASAVTRLQDTYKLDTAAMARGEIQGTQHGRELTANDCFELGRQSYNGGDHYHTVLWMQEALDRSEIEHNSTISRPEILEYLAFSTFMQGNTKHALKLTNELLEIAPNHPRATGNKVYYEDAILKVDQKKRGDDGAGDVPLETKLTENIKNEGTSEKDLYERLCRGERVISIQTLSKLKCHMVTKDHPYLLLQPAKEEEMYFRPRVVVYHDVITDKEMDVVRRLAQPRLKRATVQNYKSGELEFANYRISKSAWLRAEEHKVIDSVNKRVEAITGLDVDTAEELQVVNYGIGGHYEPHYDFARREEKNAFKSLGTGNRIATFLFYMSDVEAGGATVFPHIGLAVRPKKGSAAFWHNLHKSGDGDILTRHAACPVLAGTKWVSNKWIHERGQEFRRPCGLKINEL